MNLKQSSEGLISKANTQKGIQTVVLTSVAIQDHIVKSLELVSWKRKKNPSYKKKSKIDVLDHSKCDDKKEYVIKGTADFRCYSLAEKLGIFETISKLKLGEAEWEDRKKSSLKRNDFSDPCAICKEHYSPKRQEVLLSCSHVFHKKCMQSFFKLSNKNTCPMCRTQNYEMRVVFEGTRQTLIRSAIKIQSVWRRYIAQKNYKQFVALNPPSDPKLRKKYFREKYFGLLNSLTETYHKHCNEVDSLLDSVTMSVTNSKSFFENVRLCAINQVDWEMIRMRANERANQCSICLTKLRSERVTLLSCSHLFHTTCLSSYETFCENLHRLCPVCRSVYYKKEEN